MRRTIQPSSLRIRRAFTLIEVLIVLVVVSTIALVAMPRYADAAQRYRVKAAARSVYSDLSYARQLALAGNRSQVVQFDVAAQTYELVGVVHPDDPGRAFVVTLGGDESARMSGADFNGASDVTFDSRGRPSDGGWVRVRSGAYAKRVFVDADTGQVSLMGGFE